LRSCAARCPAWDATTEALVALRNSQGISTEVAARIDAVIAAQNAAVAQLDLSDAEVDAAKARAAASITV
jgi:hypothetical protein